MQTAWDDGAGHAVEVDLSYALFYGEYEVLCRKYELMVLSDGEQVEIGPADMTLWNVKKSTAYRYNERRLYEARLREQAKETEL